jgi:hypothetical protein
MLRHCLKGGEEIHNVPKPRYPPDDSNVSKPKKPADYNARGCIFCGSTMHWDRFCKYNKDNKLRSARAMFVDVEVSPEDVLGEMEYERCFDECLTLAEKDEEETASDSHSGESDNQDF